MQTDLVLDALEQALHARQVGKGLIHHSDSGVQYLSIRGELLDAAVYDLEALKSPPTGLYQERGTGPSRPTRCTTALAARHHGVRVR